MQLDPCKACGAPEPNRGCITCHRAVIRELIKPCGIVGCRLNHPPHQVAVDQALVLLEGKEEVHGTPV